MAAAVPTTIPASFLAGDTLLFDISLSDYRPGDGWALTYSFRKLETGEEITFTSSQNGNDHRINEAATTTQFWAAGEYSGIAFVTGSGTYAGRRHQVWSGSLIVNPNLPASGQIDTRSRARKILDFIDASFEKIVQKQVVEATIEGVVFRFRTLKELTEARDYWSGIVNTEEAKENGTTGPRRCILAQFTSPI